MTKKSWRDVSRLSGSTAQHARRASAALTHLQQTAEQMFWH